jgi:pyridoxamine 5'-phosphate oxidase
MENLREYINQLRHDFSQQQLDESMTDADPIRQFENWFREALDAKVNEPNAMTVSTVGPTGKPSARIVLLRNFDASGFVFYTNYESRKAQEIAANPHACFSFFWPELERQVIIEGALHVQSASESDKYFMNRPRSSRLGAWASPQSQELKNREALEKLLLAVTEKFEGLEVLRPTNWGGYVLVPNRIEFWQGRESRLHDRICYMLEGNAWDRKRLAP